jgi:ceramide glucosyltransferase
LQNPGTGLVTALYVGAPAPEIGWSAQLGATQISHGFLPGVLMSRRMGRQDCLGSTAMFSRDTLDRTGGFLPLVEVLAEDNVFGQRVRELGLSIELADVIPAATVPEPTLAQLWQHELRWTRTIRELAPASLCASMLQFPLFWAAVAMVLAPGEAIGVSVFLLAWLVRIGSSIAIDEALRDRVGRPAAAVPIWLFPVRDLLSVLEIIASFCVNQVVWRGHRMDASGVATAPVKANCPFETPQHTPGDLH